MVRIINPINRLQPFNCFIKDCFKKMKMKVMVSIFGRKTPVEIDFVQAELEK